MMKKFKIVLVIFCAITAGVTYLAFYPLSEDDKSLGSKISIIPVPSSLESHPQGFVLSKGTTIQVFSDKVSPDAEYLSAFLKETFRLDLLINNLEKHSKNSIVLQLDDAIDGDEAYILEVNNRNVVITGRTERGVFYGIQSLIQLIYPQEIINGKLRIPGVHISDKPEFQWRGMHLDVSRHFFPKEFIMKMIDVMAMHKLNTFHWHLTDDQGWRIEIKKYPKLTEIGAWRKETLIGHMATYPYEYDGKRYGGYYTQEDIKEVVTFAQERHINILPEIEMPGHAVAVLSAYPEFSCKGGTFDVRQIWGISDDVFCAGKESTFRFLEDVLEEVVELFPYKYIHIGGDECPKDRWEKCQDCQKRIKEEGLHDEHELQSYFVKRMESFLDSKGKNLIGWDEILEGGLPERATVMSWRGVEGGIEAVKQGHDVVMSPASHCYFDHYQAKNDEPLAIDGFLPLEKVYSFSPVPEEIKREERKHILGGQANLWTEYIETPQHVEYMLFPRISAMAEVLWSNDKNKSWESFKERMGPHYSRLDLKDINYRISPPKGFYENNMFDSEDVKVSLTSDVHGAIIRYTFDGTEPNGSSAVYKEPVTLSLDQRKILKAKVFLPNGKSSKSKTGSFVKSDYKKPVTVADKSQGLKVEQYNAPFVSAFKVSGDVERTFVSLGLSLPEEKVPAEFFGLKYSGYIEAPEKGIYNFTINSNDGAVLYIGDELLINNDGFHYSSEKQGMIALEKGLHRIKALYFQARYGKHLNLSVEYKGTGPVSVPGEWLWH